MKGKLALLVALACVAGCGPLPQTTLKNDTQASASEFARSDEAELRIDAASLLGKSKAEIARMIGPVRDCHREGDSEPIYRGEACGFGVATEPGEATEVFFIEGRAAHLTLPNFGLPFEASSLQAYGIEAGAPTFESPAVMRWDGVELGGRSVEVSMFPGGETISYLYVKSVSLP